MRRESALVPVKVRNVASLVQSAAIEEVIDVLKSAKWRRLKISENRALFGTDLPS